MASIQEIILGDGSWSFLLECLLRTFLMFGSALLIMKLTGKKEVRQFSLLELIVIIGLGSALGDPMIHRDSAVLPSLVAITTTLVAYRALSKWMTRSAGIRNMIEGHVRRVVHNGELDLHALEEEGLSSEDLFGALRVEHVDHLGQVSAVYMEVDGELSVFFHDKDNTRPGLSIMPDELELDRGEQATELCCCGRCGHVPMAPSPAICARCGGRDTRRAVTGPRRS